MDTWCGSSIERPDVVSVTILRNAMDENRQRRGRHAFAQPAAASASVFASSVHCGGALAGPIRLDRFGSIEGRQATRGGDRPQGFPLEASEARSAAGAKA